MVVELNGRRVGEAKTGADGRWLVRLPAQAANKNAAEICATRGTDKITIGNILFGDVWFGCGQSNMAYTFSGYGRLPVGGEEFLERAKGNPHIRKALRYIAANYTQKLTLQNVASEVGISPNHFSTLFHKTVGVSFREYLCQTRVEGSKQLLLYTDYSLADIAAAMGFPDQSNFSKVFKRITGISPGKYRW